MKKIIQGLLIVLGMIGSAVLFVMVISCFADLGKPTDIKPKKVYNDSDGVIINYPGDIQTTKVDVQVDGDTVHVFIHVK